MNQEEKRHRGATDPVDVALAQIDRCVTALESCKGKLTPDGYKRLRGRLGHLMDTLYTVGLELSQST